MSYGDGTVRWNPARGKWIGRYERHTGRSKRQRGWVSADTEAECWRKLKAARRTSETLAGYDERVRLDTFLTRWLSTVQASVRPRTADNYRSMVEHHIAPDLGGHKLVGLRVPHVEAWRDEMLARGDSPRSVSHRMKVLRYALEQAIRWEMLSSNVAAKAKGPHVPQGDRKPLTVAEAQRFLAHVGGHMRDSGIFTCKCGKPTSDPDPHEAIYWLALTLGMRQGEILGLRWQDVAGVRDGTSHHLLGGRVGEGRGGGADARLDALRPDAPDERQRPDAARSDGRDLPANGVGPAQLEVRKTLVWLHGATLEDPKTERSHRTLTLHSRAVAALQARRKAQNQERIAAGDRWNPKWTDGFDLVFADPEGYAIERTVVTRAFQRHLRAAGLPVVPFHSTRHTATDWMHELGMSMREIADVLGHSKPSQTSDTYSWLGNAATEKAARLLEEALA